MSHHTAADLAPKPIHIEWRNGVWTATTEHESIGGTNEIIVRWLADRLGVIQRKVSFGDLRNIVVYHRSDERYEELIDACEGMEQAHYGGASVGEEARALERLLKAISSVRAAL